MKINIANPATGAQKSFDIDDELKLRAFYDKRMSQEVEGDSLGDQFKGYIFKIAGGNDKQGFPMKQGVLTNQRVRLLLGEGHSCFRARRKGERRRKSVRGCIVGPDLSVLQLIVVKKGAEELPGLTDKEIENRLAPKRASKIRKLFNLTKEDDVRQYVIRRTLPQKEGKKQYYKSTKIQRLVTPVTLQRQRRRVAQANTRADARKTEAAEFEKLIAQRRKEAADRKASISARRASESDKTKATAAPTGKATAAPTKAAAAPATGKAAAAAPTKATGKTTAAPTKAAAPAKAAPVKAAAPAKEAAPAKAATTPAKQTAPAKQSGKSGKK